MSIFCLIAVRDEQRYLPGFLFHIRDRVDGIIALDDCSTDATPDILKAESRVVSVLREEERGPPHANETKNRYRLLVEAARLNAHWVVCADADERFETAFLRRLPEEADRGDRSGQYVRLVRIVNLWNSRRKYRLDGLCGPRWAPRMFKMPRAFTRRPFAMHQPWFPPELDAAPKAHMNAFLYHLRMIERADREVRFQKFRAVDPDNQHQSIGYGHLIDETNLKLRRVLPWRRFADLVEDKAGFQTPRADAGMVAPALPEKAEFDELFYLNENPDVRQAVAQGHYPSGWHHFERHGLGQGRLWRRRPRLLGFDFGAIFGDWRNAKS